jgi:pyrophosphate--fructose-6-phosphate 1-phosphotransferase
VDKKSSLIGFVGGTEGIFEQNTVEITDDILALYKNQGGLELLGRTVDKIKGDKQLEQVKATCDALKLDGLVLIGGSKTNTDAAHLAEYFIHAKCGTAVIGVPCGIDGSFKNQFVETTVGFDTACKVYSQLIGNIATDGNSAKKYYYFLRLMGNKPSHINLECALETHPNVTILSEEVAAKKMSLADVTKNIADTICKRAELGKNFGTVLLPEGLVAAIPEMSALIAEMNDLFKDGITDEGDLVAKLTPWGKALLDTLPPFIRMQLMLERESSGAVQLSQIEAERLLADLVKAELKVRKASGQYKGSFSAVCSFFGYQARCSMPSNFDSTYALSLGKCAAALIYGNKTGYLATITGLCKPVDQWRCGGVPLNAMTTCTGQAADEGKVRPTIPTKYVDLHGEAFKLLKSKEKAWEVDDCYENPGPIQFAGTTADRVTSTLATEQSDYTEKLLFLKDAMGKIQQTCKPGCSDEVLSAATSSLKTVLDILKIIRAKES